MPHHTVFKMALKWGCIFHWLEQYILCAAEQSTLLPTILNGILIVLRFLMFVTASGIVWGRFAEMYHRVQPVHRVLVFIQQISGNRIGNKKANLFIFYFLR